MSMSGSTEFWALSIQSLHYEYAVTTDSDVLDLAARLGGYKNPVVVVDRRVLDIYATEIGSIINTTAVYAVDALESTKTLEGVTKLISWLLENDCNRSTTIIGIGGGIIQDLVTFTANIFYRGISFVLIPTTLLSMADSCIGAKSGINFGCFKNQLGVIQAPRGVHIASSFLESLSDLDIKSGYGEILKLAITGSQEAFHAVLNEVSTNGLRGPHLLGLIRQSLEIKKVVIEKDEYEVDLRRILNYGHTFGHALEALTDHAIPHGLAVAWGIDLINFMTCKINHDFDKEDALVHEFVRTHLSFVLNDFPTAEELVAMTRRDKKMSNGKLNLAVPSAVGKLVISPVSLDEELVALVDDYLKTRNVYAPSR